MIRFPADQRFDASVGWFKSSCLRFFGCVGCGGDGGCEGYGADDDREEEEEDDDEVVVVLSDRNSRPQNDATNEQT
jgi:hypothetical protein